MDGRYLNKVLQLNANHALYRADGKWYHHLKRFPGVLFDENGYIIFHSERSYIDNPKLQRKKDLHIVDGIANLDGYTKFTEEQRLLIGNITNMSHIPSQEEIIRIKRQVKLRIRQQTYLWKNEGNSSRKICKKSGKLSGIKFLQV